MTTGTDTSIPARQRYTVKEWIALERESGRKYEYHDGEVCEPGRAATEVGPYHLTACEVAEALRKRPGWTGFEAYGPDEPLYLPDRGRYAHPAAFARERQPSLSSSEGPVADAKLIVELARAETLTYAALDRFTAYCTLPGLRYYLELDIDRPSVRLRTLTDDPRRWREELIEGLDGTIQLPELEIALPMRGLYLDVASAAVGTDGVCGAE